MQLATYVLHKVGNKFLTDGKSQWNCHQTWLTATGTFLLEKKICKATRTVPVMGSFIELNDTLQITSEQGFPKELQLDKHRKKQFTAADFKNKVFSFKDKENARIYHTTCPVFLVHNIGGKWLYWGRIRMVEQTIRVQEDGTKTTSGKYKITKIYDPAYQEQITRNETDPGKSYF